MMNINDYLVDWAEKVRVLAAQQTNKRTQKKLVALAAERFREICEACRHHPRQVPGLLLLYVLGYQQFCRKGRAPRRTHPHDHTFRFIARESATPVEDSRKKALVSIQSGAVTGALP